MGSTPIPCAAIRSSRWRSICCRRIGNFVRRRRSHGWRTCRTFARCCGWVARWWISIASRSTEFPNGSRSTSTTRSTRSTAASNCGCSTPTTTNTDFSRLSCSMARAGSSRRCFVPQTTERQGDQALSPSAAARDPRSLAPHRDPAARRQPLLRPRSSRLVSRHWPPLYPRRRADHDVASSCRRSRS
jgi:hypothetical protein